MQDSYRELFLSESQEYLGNISKCLVKLEENPSEPSSINEIFRCIHTLKGMSATMGYEKLTALCHQMEDLLDEVRNKRRALSSEIIDTLFAGMDVIEQLLEGIKTKQDTAVDITPVTEALKKFLESKEGPEGPAQAAAVKPPAGEGGALSEADAKKIKEARKKGYMVFRVGITLSRDCIMKEARAFLVITNLNRLGEIVKAEPDLEELKKGKFDFSFAVVLATKEQQSILQQELAGISEVDEVQVVAVDGTASAVSAEKSAATAGAAPAAAGPQYVKKIQSMRIPVERLDKIMNLMGELAIAKIRLMQIVQTYKIETLEEVSFALDRLISTLQDEVMQTRLLPVAYILDAFPRVVRDVAHKQNKDVELEILGSDIELDRVVLDEISDPLLHLVRNAIDHGLESPEERKKKNKPARGKLILQVARQKGQIFIEVQDDGQGVDFKAVRSVAVSRGLLTDDEAKEMDEKRVLDLITLPGFSTSEKITDISGRGVGLDVVKSRIEALGGRVDFETRPGVGSKFILTLPLTLAIIKAMLVKVVDEIFAVPLMNIRETIKIEKSEIKCLQNFEVVKVREEVIPIIRLDKELGITGTASVKKDDTDERISLVIVEYGKKAVALVVTQVIGEQDIAVKPLGSWVKRTKGIAGATILGDGRVALILDIMSLK